MERTSSSTSTTRRSSTSSPRTIPTCSRASSRSDAWCLGLLCSDGLALALTLGRDPHDAVRQVQLLQAADEPGGRIHEALIALQPRLGRARERMVVVMPGLAEGRKRE